MPAKRKPKAKAKAKSKRTITYQRLVITLSENGTPRRRAEIMWPIGRAFTLANLAKYEDCGRWLIPPGWIIRVMNGEDE